MARAFGPQAEVFGSVGLRKDSSRSGSSRQLVLSHQGILLVSNTEARVKELVSEISDILRQGRISRSKARHMAGRMSFASGQIFGRLSKSCLKAFYSVLERSPTELDPGTVAALSMYVEIAQHAPARTINLGQRPCVFVYTDASLEPTERGNVAGLGGVLCGPTREPLRFFSVFPSAQELSRIGIDLSSRCIFLLELAAVCLAFKLWGDAFRGARVVCYCDNDGAKACLMTGASSNKAANDLLKLQAAHELKTGIVPWIARVPEFLQNPMLPTREFCSLL